MKYLFLTKQNMIIFMSFLLAVTSYGQSTTGSIYGHVVSASDSTNVESVVVGLKETHYGGSTNSKGHFTLTNVEEGSYTIIFQLIGYLTIEKNITVIAGQEVNAGTV